MAFLRSDYRYKDLGLLILRIGIGVAFILHGWPKLAGGPEYWEAIGQNMKLIGISFAPTFWGFMAGLAETLGGLLLILGVFWRVTCLLLLFTMIIATSRHVAAGDDFNGYSHALEAAVLFFSLLFIGPGTYSLDHKLFPTDRHRSRFKRIVI
jgi:putative oxidoreductase